jgi:pimeloyl-ACP methyl ester carboxylesterase
VYETINGRLLRVADFGRGDRVLVAHGGWIGSWELWQQQAELLSREGWRVVSYDHRGAGQSLAAPGDISLEALVDDLLAVLDHRGIERCVLAGESMGSAVALTAALRAPERFDGLVLVGGSALWTRLQLAPFLWNLRLAYRLTLRGFIRLAVPEKDTGRQIRRWGRSILAQADRRAARALVATMIGTDLRPRLREVRVPALVIHGSRDLIVPPRFGRQLAGGIPDAQLEVLEGAGHVPTLTRPAEVTDLIRAKFGD